MALAALLVRIGADLTDLNKGLTQADRDIQKVGKKLTKLGASLTQNLTVPVAAAGAALIAASVNVGMFADSLLDLVDQTGLSSDMLQELRHVALVAGVDTDTLAQAAINLTSKLTAGAEQSKSLKDAVASLGLSVTDSRGRLVSMDTLLPSIITKLQGVRDVTTRNALAADVFGKSWTDLAPILGMGAGEMESARKRARELGLVMSKENVEAADAFRKKLDDLQASGGAIVREIGLAVLPIMEKLVDLLQADVVPAIRSVIGWFDDLSPATKVTIGAIAGLAAAAGPVLAALGGIAAMLPLLKVGFAALLGPIGLTIAAIAAVTAAGIQLVNNWGSVKLQFLLAWTQMKDAVFTGSSWILKALSGLFFKVPALSMEFLKMGLAVDQMAKDSLLDAMPKIDALGVKIMASADATTTFTKKVVQLGNALRGLPKGLTLPGLTKGMKTGEDSILRKPVALGPFKFTDEMGEGLRRNIPTPGDPKSPEPGIGSAIMGQMPQIVQSFAAFGPMAVILPVISGALESLQPLITALEAPLTMVGQLLGAVLAPVIRTVTVAFSYVMEAMGWLVRGIGKLVDSLPFVKAQGVIDAGQAMMDAARAARKNGDANAYATKELERFAGALSNVPNVFNVNALRHAMGGSPIPSASNRNGGGNTTIYITVPGAGDPVAVAENVGRAIESARRRGSTSRIVLAGA